MHLCVKNSGIDAISIQILIVYYTYFCQFIMKIFFIKSFRFSLTNNIQSINIFIGCMSQSFYRACNCPCFYFLTRVYCMYHKILCEIPINNKNNAKQSSSSFFFCRNTLLIDTLYITFLSSDLSDSCYFHLTFYLVSNSLFSV